MPDAAARDIPRPRLIERLRAGEPAALARALTLVETGGADAQTLLRQVHDGQHTDPARHAVVVGFTGPPGAGKSTLISAYIRTHVREQPRERNHALGSAEQAGHQAVAVDTLDDEGRPAIDRRDVEDARHRHAHGGHSAGLVRLDLDQLVWKSGPQDLDHGIATQHVDVRRAALCQQITQRGLMGVQSQIPVQQRRDLVPNSDPSDPSLSDDPEDLPPCGAADDQRLEPFAPLLVVVALGEPLPLLVERGEIVDPHVDGDQRFLGADAAGHDGVVGLPDAGTDGLPPLLHRVDGGLLHPEPRLELPACDHHRLSLPAVLVRWFARRASLPRPGRSLPVWLMACEPRQR